jgi:hypothetical protein
MADELVWEPRRVVPPNPSKYLLQDSTITGTEIDPACVSYRLRPTFSGMLVIRLHSIISWRRRVRSCHRQWAHRSDQVNG